MFKLSKYHPEYIISKEENPCITKESERGVDRIDLLLWMSKEPTLGNHVGVECQKN